VHEALSATPEGGLLRRIRVGPGSSPLWVQLQPQPGADIVVKGAERDGSLACFTSTNAGEFTIEIRRKALLSP
jgi:hypothetical protein